MQFTSTVLLCLASAVAAAASALNLTEVGTANATATSCFDQPTIVYPNGSNSTYECWLSQFPSYDSDSPNSNLGDCKGANNGNCFFIGNDRKTTPNLRYEYYLASINQRTTTIRRNVNADPVWRRVDMAHGTVGLYYYSDGTCLDAFWAGGTVKVHQWGCEYGNPNQWWRYKLHEGVQLFEHGTHVGWCLQTNGIGTNIEMTRCNWDITEQHRRLYL